ncbi:MAG: hypothetical protein JNK54_00105 [Elusimicrobia bacterium]|jgi:hypothetical protein|nr:hypothetical protein [Elusimicrobiota bacterium]
MSPRTLKADRIRAALKETEEQVRETLMDLESNDVDDQAVAERLRALEVNVRRLRRAA